MYRVGIVCDNGNLFINSKGFPTIGSALNFMIEAGRLLDERMAIQDEKGKTILQKGLKID